MEHVHHSTPTAGLEAILGDMPLDLHTQCVVAWVAYRVWGQNQNRWDGMALGTAALGATSSGAISS